MVVAPLYPPVYLLGAIAMGVKYWATKYAICYVWRPPPPVQIDLIETFRSNLAYLVPPHLLMAYLVEPPFEQTGSYFGVTVIAAAGGVWLVYKLLGPWVSRMHYFRLYEQLDIDKINLDDRSAACLRQSTPLP